VRIPLLSAVILAGVALMPFATSPLRAEGNGPQLGDALVQQWKIGVTVSSGSGPCRGIVATLPIPSDWPEQQVRIVDQQVSPYCTKLDERTVSGTVKQLVVEIPRMPPGEEAEVMVIFEVSRNSLVAPTETSGYTIPEFKQLDKQTRSYLGPSPYIESTNAKIKKLAKETIEGKATAWEQVEALFDWVRTNIESSQKPIPIKGAVRALKDGNGDCEDLSSLFIAMCRSLDIPARTVWVPGHCYPEFYLVDAEGEGHWFPCEPHGSRAFGGIPEHRPILQKGDNFRDPDRPRDKLRYLSEFLTGAGGRPKVSWTREAVNAP
jgi:hypothetical protein